MIRLRSILIPPWKEALCYAPSLYLAFRLDSVHWYFVISSKLIEKLISGISLMKFISDTLSFVWVDLCVVSWFPLKGIFDSMYATLFLLPLMYSISGPYSLIISLRLNILSPLKF